MYEERRESFSLKDLIIHILLIILVILILLFIFSPHGYLRKMFGENKEKHLQREITASLTELDGLAVLYNQVFADNVEKMKETAIDFYKNNNIPQNQGETSTILLQQMYEEKLLDTVKDENGKACNSEKSYVTLTKAMDSYELKVNLSCADNEQSIIFYLEPSFYCSDTACEQAESQNKLLVDSSEAKRYVCEYDRTTGGNWSDWGEWSDWTTTEIIATDNIQVETKQETQEVGSPNSYTTKLVKVGVKKVKVGTTTKLTKKKIISKKTKVYVKSDSGTKVPTNNDTYVYIVTGTKKFQACSTCQVVNNFTWDVYQIRNVYKTEIVKETVPVYKTEPIYELQKVKSDITDKNSRSTTKTVTYYRSRSRQYIKEKIDKQWSTCTPLDVDLIIQGYKFIGNKKEV